MSRVEAKKCRGSRVNVEGSKMSAFFCYLKTKETNKVTRILVAGKQGFNVNKNALRCNR